MAEGLQPELTLRPRRDPPQALPPAQRPSPPGLPLRQCFTSVARRDTYFQKVPGVSVISKAMTYS